jgi:hypothetical protein
MVHLGDPSEKKEGINHGKQGLSDDIMVLIKKN